LNAQIVETVDGENPLYQLPYLPSLAKAQFDSSMYQPKNNSAKLIHE